MEISNSSECKPGIPDPGKLSVLEVDVTPFLVDAVDNAPNTEPNTLNQINTRIDQFVCDLCKLNFDDKISFDRHYSLHKQNLFTCECGMTFLRKRGFIEHQKLHKEEKFFCDLCSKSFAAKSLLNSHRLTHTLTPSKDQPHECDICGRSFPLKYYFIRHYRVCEKSKLKNNSHLDGAINASSGDSEFSDKISLDTLYLARLPKTDNQFVCCFCKETFSRKYHLTNHYRSFPTHKPYTCDICKRTFMQKNILTKHYRFHTKEKPFVCDICGKGFYERKDLRYHNHWSHSK